MISAFFFYSLVPSRVFGSRYLNTENHYRYFINLYTRKNATEMLQPVVAANLIQVMYSTSYLHIARLTMVSPIAFTLVRVQFELFLSLP